MNDQLPLFTGSQLRDEALARLENHNIDWMTRGLIAIASHINTEMTGEDIRRILRRIIGDPTHHNAWGALISRAVKRGLIEPTGEWRPMQLPRSHARQTPVYRRAGMTHRRVENLPSPPAPDLPEAWADLKRAVVEELKVAWRKFRHRLNSMKILPFLLLVASIFFLQGCCSWRITDVNIEEGTAVFEPECLIGSK